MSETRLDLPFTGITSFCKLPICEDLNQFSADVAIIGAPFDLGTQYRSGARMGPRGIRNASAIYGMEGSPTMTMSLTLSSWKASQRWTAAMWIWYIRAPMSAWLTLNSPFARFWPAVLCP